MNKKLLYLLFCILIVGCEKNKESYGLDSNEGFFASSFFVTDSKLVVNGSNSFEEAFKSEGFVDLVERVNRSSRYLQAEPLYLPIIQKISPGKNFSFVFEKVNKKDDYLEFGHIGIECQSIDKDVLAVPSDCIGYYLRDTNNWPPVIEEFVGGNILISQKDLLDGYISGKMNLEMSEMRRIEGNFFVFDKNKRLFLCEPARL